MIYYFVSKSDYISEMQKGSQSKDVIVNDYHVMRFESDNDVPKELYDYNKYTQDTYKNALLAIRSGEQLRTKKNVDQSGRPISRITFNSEGWSFLAHFVELTTSTIDGIYCQDENGNKEVQHYAQFFDADDNQLLTQAECDAACVKSVFTIIPAIDYEIVSGEIHQYERPQTNMRMHTRLGAFLPDGTPLSTKEFVRNLNMKFKDKAKAIVTDGRAPKMLRKEFAGLPFDANQIQIIIYHPDAVGYKHEAMIEIEYYRE